MMKGEFSLINVKYNEKIYKVKNNTKVIDFVKETLKIKDKKLIACKVFYEVKSLDYVMDRDCTLELLYTTCMDGSRIYVRGLTFILIKAFEELYPGRKLSVNYSLGHSLYCESGNFKFTPKVMETIKARMDKLIKADLPFEQRVLTLDEAMNLYEDAGREDKLILLETRMKTHVSIYYCGDSFNYFYGAMPPSTS